MTNQIRSPKIEFRVFSNDISRGKFIVFDGNEGCGKSTQARMLQRCIGEAGVPSTLVRDPGTTRIGELIRTILLDPQNTDMSMRCEMLLYMAARAQMMKDIVRPALEEGRVSSATDLFPVRWHINLEVMA